MVKGTSFRLATALLGLLIVILPFLGLSINLKTIFSVILGFLVILFSLAGTGNETGEKNAAE